MKEIRITEIQMTKSKHTALQNTIEIINLDQQNIHAEGIFCLRGKKDIESIKCRMQWLQKSFADGLRIRMLKAGGRSWGFIEYVPAEYAWRPVEAAGYIIIHCFWITAPYDGRGWGHKLLQECLNDPVTKQSDGIAVVTGKRPWLTDKDIFLKNGFEIADTAPPYFELLAKRNTSAPLPRFKPAPVPDHLLHRDGLVIWYGHQCPYVAKRVKEMTAVARELGIPAQLIKLESPADAQAAPAPYGTLSIFYKGKFLTHEPLSAKMFRKRLLKTGVSSGKESA
jgi:hypothetical protein